MSDRNPRKNHRNYKSLSDEFFDQIFGTNSPTMKEKHSKKQEKTRERENKHWKRTEQRWKKKGW
jgi:hypothetical protein